MESNQIKRNRERVKERESVRNQKPILENMSINGKQEQNVEKNSNKAIKCK